MYISPSSTVCLFVCLFISLDMISLTSFSLPFSLYLVFLINSYILNVINIFHTFALMVPYCLLQICCIWESVNKIITKRQWPCLLFNISQLSHLCWFFPDVTETIVELPPEAFLIQFYFDYNNMEVYLMGTITCQYWPDT